MRMLDLFCGRGGWTNAFLDRGWECVGIDLNPQPEYRGKFIQRDVMELTHHDLAGFDFICASSPCEEFSTMRNFRQPVPHPDIGIKLFEHTKALCEAAGVPYIMENVAGAGRFVGRAVNHCGSYYLWGKAVPPILPQNIRKGMTELAMGLREHKGKPGWDMRHGKRGQTPTAIVATIPPELANCVADYAERICDQRVNPAPAKE